MAGTIKMFCIRMNIFSHRNNIVLFLVCNMTAMQNLYTHCGYSLAAVLLVDCLNCLCDVENCFQ